VLYDFCFFKPTQRVLAFCPTSEATWGQKERTGNFEIIQTEAGPGMTIMLKTSVGSIEFHVPSPDDAIPVEEEV
jgi:hypothetical protein